jgi:RND family efflux transporter MFP subunit
MAIPHCVKALAAALLLAVAPHVAAAHEGHDDVPKTSTLTVAPRAEALAGTFELVAVAGSGGLTIYIDRFATNEPVPDASLTVETPTGSVEATATGDGTYRLAAPWSRPAGHYDLIFTVTKGGEAQVLPLTLEVPTDTTSVQSDSATDNTGSAAWNGSLVAALLVLLAAFGGFAAGRWRRVATLLVVIGLGTFLAGQAVAHDGEDHGAPPVAPTFGENSQRLSDGSVFVPKSAQRILAIRTQLSEQAVYRRSIELPGRIIPNPDASGYVQAAVGGRLSPPPSGFPRLGTEVKKGDILAYVTPPLQAIDASDMRQRQGELDQQINIVERRLQRYESLLPSGAVAKSQYDDTKFELQGLRDRRVALDRARQNPEALLAPVDGVIADGTPVAGQMAQTNAIIFHIIDPTKLWVEALSYQAAPTFGQASARINGKEVSLSFRGAGFADRNQSIPIHFAIEGDVSGLRVGQFITVLAETDEKQSGIAVPRTSLVRGNAGQDAVYEHIAAERFQRVPVRIEPLDGERVLVSQGLTPGKRIVVQGAELLDNIR